jgi:hypothetical protein
VLLRMPLLLRGSVEISAAAKAILPEDGKDPNCGLGPQHTPEVSWYETKQ